MDWLKIKIKRMTDNRKYKDWERHARVITLLQLKHKTITEMANEIDEYVPLVSACIWGIPGRQNPRIEGKIAYFLGVTRAELFGGIHGD